MGKEIEEGENSKPSTGKQELDQHQSATSSPPELPPKTAIQSYPSIITTTNHSKQSNKILIRFLFSLSNFIFFGGTLAGLIVWFYQKYIFPKLRIRTEILKSLRLSTLKSYDKLHQSLKSLIQSNPRLYQSTLAKLSGKVDQVLSTSSDAKTGDGLDDAGKASDQIQVSEGSSTTDEKTQVPDIVPSSSSSTSSSSILDEKELQNEPHKPSSDREEFNQPVIDYLEKIAQGLRKRSDNRRPVQIEESDDEQMDESRAGTERSLGGIESLTKSLKSMGAELADEAQLNTRVHQKLSASSHPHRAFGLNHWTASFNATRYPDAPPPKNVDEDPYFIALMEFKNQIRNLKGVLLNRKKFY
ncbi:hypothetical protein PGT21_030020 [Puccinia graminis f. sp. tritici]|uniref:Uncharacterized protein n=2 Tax=Puccinia graminis f. sp. tritici TaxID=56615 RepID=E3JSX1_PUCGT|nr:uncharacterized protein PGTG_01739 [Puccinia graminis f. sp. tritici CRL 75-36-700-3]EFP75146.1 hypothetical protein PGTG_01739 [Puccinia graminis f. sp. tritici CRL 75-36-700-3]KAA1118031.1 hypothetical protein PGT21_030020 [Puccinia graminis f. sp. tritici]